MRPPALEADYCGGINEDLVVNKSRTFFVYSSDLLALITSPTSPWVSELCAYYDKSSENPSLYFEDKSKLKRKIKNDKTQTFN